MSGIVGSRLNNRGSGLIGSLGTDGQVLTSSGAGVGAVYEAGAIDDNAVTLAKMAGLARGNLIYGDTSGDPAALAVGSANEVLTHDGTDFDWAAAAGGGITHASVWALTIATSGSVDPMTSWSEYGTPLGASMTISSGIFTFPSTGWWRISLDTRASGGSAASHYNTEIKVSTDYTSGPTWVDEVSGGSHSHPSSASPLNTSQNLVEYILDVTSTTDVKVATSLNISTDSGAVVTGGTTPPRNTTLLFVRYADT